MAVENINDTDELRLTVDALEMVPQYDSKYIEEREVHNFFDFKKLSGINILHINARSIEANFQNVESLLTNIDGTLTAIAVSETWLSLASQETFSIPGYSFVANSRPTGGGGGVGIFIRTSLSYFVHGDLSRMYHYLECIFVEIPQVGKKNIIIGCIYRPSNRQSNADTDLFNSEFKKILESIDCYKNKTIFLAGDFNLNLLHHNIHAPTADFLNNMLSFAYLPSITRPTRITDHSRTLLDNIFTKSIDHHVNSVIIFNDISDHCPIAVHSIDGVGIKKTEHLKTRKFDARSIENFNKELVNEKIWDDVNMFCEAKRDPSAAYDSFLKIYSEAFNKHFPERATKKRSCNAPLSEWMTKGLLRSCNKKSRLYKKLKITNSPFDTEKYITYRNKLKTIIGKAKRNYYIEKFKSLQGNLQDTWHLLGTLVKKNKTAKDDIAESYNDNGKLITDKIEISNRFNDYFSDVGINLASKIPSTAINISKFLKRSYLHSFSLYYTDAEEIRKVVSNFENKMSSGYDNIPVSIMKSTIIHIAEPLSKIINCSISTGKFPDKLKIAKVCPVFKSGDKEHFENYRPISILPSFSKVFEKIIHIRLVNYLESKNILPDNQYGFRKGISGAMAIAEMCDKISAATDRNEFSVGVFIDLSKAFDTINHSILLKKLEHYGIRGLALDLFQNYLHNRKQYVYANRTSSNICDIKCGVPQGSILGPLLFLLYISDIENCSDILSFILFADDTNLFYSCNNLPDLYSIVNCELSKLSEWFCVNKLSLNVKKTNYIIFGNKKKVVNYDHLKLEQDGKVIDQVYETKFLGVYLDNKLNWKAHISHLRLKLSRGIGIMNRVRHIVPRKVLLMLYHTLIYPYLVYCNVSWGSANKSLLNTLFILQKRAVRICSGSTFRSHSSPLFSNLRLLKLIDVINFQTAIFMYKIKYKLVPQCCMHYATVNSADRFHNTRNLSYFVKIHFRTNIRAHSLSVRGPQLWDTLPLSIQQEARLGCFKRVLFQHYLLDY